MTQSLNFPDTGRAIIAGERRRNPVSIPEDLLSLNWPRYDEIPKPINLEAMRGWHRASYWGKWKAAQMAAEMRDCLILRDGCVHAKIDFDLTSRAGIAAYRAFVEAAADLVVAPRRLAVRRARRRPARAPSCSR